MRWHQGQSCVEQVPSRAPGASCRWAVNRSSLATAVWKMKQPVDAKATEQVWSFNVLLGKKAGKMERWAKEVWPSRHSGRENVWSPLLISSEKREKLNLVRTLEKASTQTTRGKPRLSLWLRSLRPFKRSAARGGSAWDAEGSRYDQASPTWCPSHSRYCELWVGWSSFTQECEHLGIALISLSPRRLVPNVSDSAFCRWCTDVFAFISFYQEELLAHEDCWVSINF